MVKTQFCRAFIASGGLWKALIPSKFKNEEASWFARRKISAEKGHLPTAGYKFLRFSGTKRIPWLKKSNYPMLERKFF